MTIVKRLRLLTAVLGAAAASAVIGTTVFGDVRTNRPATPDTVVGKALGEAERAAEEFAKSKYATQPALVYKGKSGPASFAWQVKPTALPAAVRDRDILIMVDTSASQAGEPLKRARNIIAGLASTAAGNDRVDVWTINLDDPKGTRSLTGGFKPAGSEAIHAAAASLTETEFASGATDLKAGLEKALKAFEPAPARQQVILFLGDGDSTAGAGPVTEAVRVDLGGRMDSANVAFFAVPLGLKVNAQNLHGFAALTGGTVLRLGDDLTTARARTDFAVKIKAAIDVPVLKPTAVTFAGGVAETFPTRLPPLRADKATLVVGTLKDNATTVAATIAGTVAGRAVTIEVKDNLPAAEDENYFVHAMIEQWKNAGTKDAPAILAADRALALASQQFRLFREEYLTQAVYAVSSDKVDQAVKLYEAALKIDPTSREALAGLGVVAKIRTGEITRDKLIKAGKSAEAVRNNLAKLSQDNPPVAGGAVPPAAAGAAPAVAPGDALRQAQAERAVQEQQFRVLIDETIRRARAGLAIDPDSAYEDLKRQRDVVLANPQLSDAFRARLVGDLEAMMQTVSSQGGEIKRRAGEERERVARTQIRINEYARQHSDDERTRSQIDAFKQLMSQARYELAQQEAQVMIQDRVARGQGVPSEAIASYMIGQSATNLREHRELVRIREDRYLLTMMQVEKSFIPYPDEPPVHFPPAAVWRELTADRAKYSSGAGLGAGVTPSMRRIQATLEGPEARRVKIENELDGMPLKDLLSFLEKDLELKFVVLEDEFKAGGEAAILDKKIGIKQKLFGVTAGPFLDIVLQSIGATYVVRPEYIEITTFEKRLKEKVIMTYDVTELLYDIPQSVNRATLQQNQNVQNQNLTLFGQATFAGGFGQIGGLGLGGNQGGLGLGGIGLGGGGGGGGVNPNQQQFAANGAANNLGNGGGITGISGGQIGQFGNLGGQFGIQGNADANYPALVKLIKATIAPGEWKTNLFFEQAAVGNAGQAGNAANGEEDAKILPVEQLNEIGYWKPSRALIITATGKYHPNSSVKLKKLDGGAVQGGPGNPARGQVVGANPAAPPAAGGAVAANATVPNPQEDMRKILAKVDRTMPNKMWQQVMDASNVDDPGLVVASADFLFERNEPMHAAEIIKAGLRRGLTTDVWAQDALAIALKAGKGDTFDAQRAGMSAADLEPTDAKSYIKAAKVAAENDLTDAALAYCKRAAALDPDQPLAYANALVYAEKAGEVKADAIAWASNNLLQRDWINDGVDFHTETRARMMKIVNKFPAGAEQFKKALEQDAQRDLVIELLWQGSADLDLYVSEPSGSTAGPTNKLTTGGGVLKADDLTQKNDKSEVYTASQAMSGTYTVSAKQAFKTAIGGKAQVKVTKFKGTDREAVELHTLTLSEKKPLTITLDGGSRTTLAMTPEPIAANAEMVAAPKGFSGGAGGAAPAATNLPTVVKPFETRLAGITPTAPSMRAVQSVTPDRKSVRITANVVFSGPATDLPMPTVSLLPGGER